MIKKFIVSLSSIISISCIVYYTSKYYEEYYDSLCHHLQNSRELSLDIFDKMQERS